MYIHVGCVFSMLCIGLLCWVCMYVPGVFSVCCVLVLMCWVSVPLVCCCLNYLLGPCMFEH